MIKKCLSFVVTWCAVVLFMASPVFSMEQEENNKGSQELLIDEGSQELLFIKEEGEVDLEISDLNEILKKIEKDEFTSEDFPQIIKLIHTSLDGICNSTSIERIEKSDTIKIAQLLAKISRCNTISRSLLTPEIVKEILVEAIAILPAIQQLIKEGEQELSNVDNPEAKTVRSCLSRMGETVTVLLVLVIALAKVGNGNWWTISLPPSISNISVQDIIDWFVGKVSGISWVLGH